MYQLTFYRDPINDTDRTPNAHELWSWKANAFMGCTCLVYHQERADIYMDEERTEAFYTAGYYVPVDNHIVYPVRFIDDTDTTIEHAVALKRYNGIGLTQEQLAQYGYDTTGLDLGNRQYCEWNNDLGWIFHPIAYYYYNNAVQQHNYVDRICTVVP